MVMTRTNKKTSTMVKNQMGWLSYSFEFGLFYLPRQLPETTEWPLKGSSDSEWHLM